MNSQILDFPFGSRAGDFSKSLGHFPECDVIRGGCILDSPLVRGIKRETCRKKNIDPVIFAFCFLLIMWLKNLQN